MSIEPDILAELRSEIDARRLDHEGDTRSLLELAAAEIERLRAANELMIALMESKGAGLKPQPAPGEQPS